MFKMIRAKSLALALGGALALAAPAHAHRAWMLPSTFTLSGEEQYVTVDAAVSNNLFYPNHVAMGLDDLEVTRPDGSKAELENAHRLKFRSVFDVKLDQQGTYKISTSGAGYFASWTEDGKPQRKRGSLEDLLAAGIDKKPGAEIRKSVRRTETFVTLGAPSEEVFAPSGSGLELQPVTHPNDVYAGEEVSFRFLKDGKPAGGIEVDIVRGEDRYRDAEDKLTVKAGDDGLVAFTLDTPGRYWLSAGDSGETTVNGMKMQQTLSYVATIEALPN